MPSPGFDHGDDIRLDDQLQDLARGVVERVGFDPPDVKTRLVPPRLSVVKGPANLLNAYSLAAPEGSTTILMGGGLYDFLHHYTRAAAAHFLPTSPNGPRPSVAWPRARKAMATTLEWISSPGRLTKYPDIELTPRQAQAAQALGAYAYRFALCHELGHVALDDYTSEATAVLVPQGDHVTILRSLQDGELEADRFGLGLQMRSLPDPTQVVNGLAGAVYFTEAMALLHVRLMLLADLVDYREWRIKYTHPPPLQRVFGLMAAAGSLFGEEGSSGLSSLHGQLAELNGELMHAANRNKEKAAANVTRLVDEEVARVSRLLRAEDASRRAIKARLGLEQDPRHRSVISKMLRLFEQSPLGVVTVLATRPARHRLGPTQRAHVAALVNESLLLALPTDFQRFVGLSRGDRVDQILGMRLSAVRPRR